MTTDLIVGDLSLSDATLARLRLHRDQLLRWNAAINLVAKSTLPEAWHRHFVDSAQLVPLAPAAPVHWLDLGSGAGFPGLVVSTILAERSPATRVTLVEADRRKATFLRETIRLLGLETTVLAQRIESLPPLQADVVSARALAPLDRLIPLAARHLAVGGVALLQKGSSVDSELASAFAAWSFSVERLASQTEPSAEILRLKDLHHV
ncbi:MAG: 16S rRNA (guanine(527)-N(7))-methyltransferase RsmG [Gemmobacter sp.]